MFEKGSIAPADQLKSGSELVHPLDDFYARAGCNLPPLGVIEGDTMPEPYKRLLVHQNDMTPTLEDFHRSRIHLRVLGSRQSESQYFREVVLMLDRNNQPVEFGASKINLALFSAEAQAQILSEKMPLGHILQEYQIPHSSRPRAFFRLASDRLINEVLGLSGAQVLYGRRNTLFDPQQRPLAEIVEILPIASKRDSGN